MQARVSTLFNLKRVSILFDSNQHRLARKKVFRGTSMTFKLLLSFIQVVSGSFYMINMSWTPKTKDLLNFININPLHAIDATYQCSTMNISSNFRHFIVLVVYFLIPFIFLIILYIVSYLVYLYSIKKLSNDGLLLHDSNNPNSRLSNIRESNNTDSISLSSNKSEFISEKSKYLKLKQEIWDISAKIFLWFCLIAYPTLSSGYVNLFFYFLLIFLLCSILFKIINFII